MIKKYAEQFFEWYCNPDYFEDIKGDLEELYYRQKDTTSLRRAEWAYAWEVILLFRPSIIRPIQGFRLLNNWDMIQNYLKIAFRNLLKHKFYSAIHILGLALGLAAFLLINQYTSFEKSYDNFHPHSENTYRLITDNIVNGKLQVQDAMSFAPSGALLQERFPEVVNYTTTHLGEAVFLKENEPIEEQKVMAADSNFLDIFGYEVLEGDKEKMLTEPYTAVLTESTARKYFGEKDPIGKTLKEVGNHDQLFTVTGIIEDAPENTHYKFDLLISLGSIKERIERDGWGGFNYYTYLVLKENTDIDQFTKKIAPVLPEKLGENANLYAGLQPIEDIHLHSDITFEPEINGNAKAVGFLTLISIFILLIAWINYVNLSTARAVERAREVGMRKVVGARKRQLIGQFLIESLVINFLGALAALFLADLFLPLFNNIVGKPIVTNLYTDPDFLKKLGIFFLVGTLVAGFYPALVLSNFKPIGVLKGAFSRSQRGVLLRKALVVFQFAASIILIASTIIVYLQVNYMTNKDMGINIDQVMGFTNPRVSGEVDEQFLGKFKTFQEEIAKIPGVKNTAYMSNLPGGGSSDVSSRSGKVRIIGKSDRIDGTVYILYINDQVQETLDIDLLAGRNFDREFAGDSMAIMVNEAFLKKLNISDPSSVINEFLQFGTQEDNRKFPIVGVLADYNRTTLKSDVEPTIYAYSELRRYTIIKLGPENIAATVERIEQRWNEFFPQAPFEYAFLDERFDRLYQEDKRFGMFFANFSILAIFVAGLGLFGLSSFLSVQRTKEVGVRKVLGASVSNIVFLFFKDFFWLILVAVVIGIPLIYIGMNEWLNNYAYRIDFPWWVMLLAIISVTLLAFLTISYQTYKLARLNPAKTIRYE